MLSDSSCSFWCVEIFVCEILLKNSCTVWSLLFRLGFSKDLKEGEAQIPLVIFSVS